jgi:hypothetical protein
MVDVTRGSQDDMLHVCSITKSNVFDNR